jgi:hypothetical protein
LLSKACWAKTAKLYPKKKKLKEKRARAYSSDRSLVYKSRALSSNSSTAKTKM